MAPKTFVWLAVCGSLVVILSATAISGWVFGAVVAASLLLAIPLGVKRYRAERNLARLARRAFTTR